MQSHHSVDTYTKEIKCHEHCNDPTAPPCCEMPPCSPHTRSGTSSRRRCPAPRRGQGTRRHPCRQAPHVDAANLQMFEFCKLCVHTYVYLHASQYIWRTVIHMIYSGSTTQHDFSVICRPPSNRVANRSHSPGDPAWCSQEHRRQRLGAQERSPAAPAQRRPERRASMINSNAACVQAMVTSTSYLSSAS